MLLVKVASILLIIVNPFRLRFFFSFQTDWYAAYSFLLVVFGQITIYFLLGNLVEIKVCCLKKGLLLAAIL